MKAKIKREFELLIELQRDHGYMFHETPRKSERNTMHFKRNLKTGKHSLNSARMMRVSAPSTSWLATEMDKLAKSKPKPRRR